MSWQISEDPITPNLPVVVVDQADTGRDVSVGFSGRGLIRPFRRLSSDFASATGADLVRSAVGQVLGTRLGELPQRTDFGTLLHLLRQRLNSLTLLEQARYFVITPLARWVPRARVTGVQSRRTADGVFIDVEYDVLDEAGSRVVVPGVQTSVALG